jgi:hypothetical protein
LLRPSKEEFQDDEKKLNLLRIRKGLPPLRELSVDEAILGFGDMTDEYLDELEKNKEKQMMIEYEIELRKKEAEIELLKKQLKIQSEMNETNKNSKYAKIVDIRDLTVSQRKSSEMDEKNKNYKYAKIVDVRDIARNKQPKK